MQEAFKKLGAAKSALDQGDRETACYRAYYAMFDACKAALLFTRVPLTLEKIRTNHELVHTFEQHIIKAGILGIDSSDYGKALLQVLNRLKMPGYIDDMMGCENAAKVIDISLYFLTLVQTRFARELTQKPDYMIDVEEALAAYNCPQRGKMRVLASFINHTDKTLAEVFVMTDTGRYRITLRDGYGDLILEKELEFGEEIAIGLALEWSRFMPSSVLHPG